MREILFRGKVTKVPKYLKDRMKVGTWVYGSYVSYPVEQIFDLEDEYIIDPATVGQFTGFCDKHGVRIFEGDKFTDPTGDIYTVKWEEYSGAWEFFSKDGSFLFVMECFDMFEVIGNIYDKEEQDALQGKFAQNGRCTFDE